MPRYRVIFKTATGAGFVSVETNEAVNLGELPTAHLGGDPVLRLGDAIFNPGVVIAVVSEEAYKGGAWK